MPVMNTQLHTSVAVIRNVCLLEAKTAEAGQEVTMPHRISRGIIQKTKGNFVKETTNMPRRQPQLI